MGEAKKERREVYWIGKVDEVHYQKVVAKIVDYYEKSPQQEITLYVTSQGGKPDIGLAFCDLIRINKIPLKAIGLGALVSSGLIVFLAADRRVAGGYCRFMMRPLRYYPEDSGLSLEDLSAEASIEDLLVKKTKMNPGKVREWKKSEKYISTQQALEWGLIDEII